jgi:hypothetical protein
MNYAVATHAFAGHRHDGRIDVVVQHLDVDSKELQRIDKLAPGFITNWYSS